MLIEVNDNLFVNAKNISYVRIKKNHIDFTELGNEHLEDIEISSEGRKELCEFFNFDEDFIETSFFQGEAQYVNVRAISKVTIEENPDLDDDIILSIKFINDAHPWSEPIPKESALEIVNEIRKKIAKTAKAEYVDHF